MPRAVFAFALLFVLLVGCKPQSTPPIAPTQTPTTPTPAEESQQPDQGATQAANPSAAEVAESGPDASHEPTETTTTDAPEPEPASAVRSARMLVLMEREPILIDVHATIAGQPLAEFFQSCVDRLLKIGDTNQDGVTQWEEISNDTRFQQGLFGNVQFNDERQRQEMLHRYDVDQDGELDRDEVPRFLTRNAGGSRAFSMQESNFYRYYNRHQSAILDAIDQSSDDQLSEEELNNIPNRLLEFDLNGDGSLTLDEIVQDVDNPRNRLPNRKRPGPLVGFLITESTSWVSLKTNMQDTYAFGSPITSEHFKVSSEFFTQLDGDRNDQLTGRELMRLLEVQPHLQIHINLEPTTDQPSIEVKARAYGVADPDVSHLTDTRHVVATLPHGQLRLFVNDTLENTVSAEAEQTFNRVDTDNNGYVDKEEAAQIGGNPETTFSLADENGDEKIYLDELTSYLSLQQLGTRGQVRARMADESDVYFAALDTDLDGRLSAREIAHAAGRLREFDRDNNAAVSSAELPGAMVIGFARGNAESLNTLFTIPAGTPAATSERPDWFQRMDANSDGDITTDEFLGDASLFAELDQDGDGFLSWSEVAEEAENNKN